MCLTTAFIEFIIVSTSNVRFKHIETLEGGVFTLMKEKRHEIILELLKQAGVVKVSELVDILDVTEMTIRRDLKELENNKSLIRIHGGARKVESELLTSRNIELSHRQKRDLYLNEKKHIARIIAENILENETVFLGSGTTIELVHDYLTINRAKIITNSIYVFDKFKYDDRFELILTGGSYRSKTGSFTGTIANDFLSTINVQKAFIGVNTINNYAMFNANEDEGVVQRTILNNAREKFIVANNNKFNKLDFYQFYDIREADYLITDNHLPQSLEEYYSEWVKVLK